MAIQEGKYLSDFLKWEHDRNYCRELVSVASGQNLKSGAVVGLVTETGLVKEIFLVPSSYEGDLDGSEVAFGVLLEDVDATSAVAEGVMLARLAIVAEDGLVFSAVPTADQRAKVISDLDAHGILVRKTV
jgi:hypothetical protein